MSGNQRNRWEPILGILTIQRATREWQLKRPCRKFTRPVCQVLRLCPLLEPWLSFWCIFLGNTFCEVSVKQLTTPREKRRWSCLGPGFHRWKSPWWAGDLNLETQVVVKASQTVTPCLRQHEFLRVRSLSKAMENCDFGSFVFCSIQPRELV